MLFPDRVNVPVAPVAARDSPVIAFVLEIFPLIARVPPAVWVKVALVAAAPPRMIGAEMVFVPLVFEETIAEPFPAVAFVPVLVSVRAEVPFNVHPPVDVVKRICWLVMFALRIGWLVTALLKTAASEAVGSPPVQLAPVL